MHELVRRERPRLQLHVYEEPPGVPAGVTLCDAAAVLPRNELFVHRCSGSVAVFADWFRYRLLLEHGGMWVDTDVVCLQAVRSRGPEIFAWQDAVDHQQRRASACRKRPCIGAMDGRLLRAAESLPAVRPLRTRRRKLQRRLLPGQRRGRRQVGRNGPGWTHRGAQPSGLRVDQHCRSGISTRSTT